MQFFNPLLLAGAALFAVPLIIHLLNRQRHKTRPWAAMEFLLRAYQKQRNRLRNENLLLLLLRCLVPIVLALAIARPMLKNASGLLAGSGTTHHVLVLDGTYSMGLRGDGAQSPFERGRTLIGRLLERYEQNTARTDKVSLVLAGVRPRFLVRDDLDLGTAKNQWLSMQKPEDAATDLGDALRQVADALQEGGDADAEVLVFSDLQARSFGRALAAPAAEAAPELTDTLRDVVDRLQKRPGTRLHWIDVGPFAEQHAGGQLDNQQITDLRIDQPAAVLRAPVEFVASLKNRSQQAVSLEVTLDVDGGEPARKVVQLPAGADGEADFQISFRETGRRRVHVQVQNDGLPADDERFLTVDVRERIRVLLVDGAAADDPLRAHRHLWRSILDPDAEALPTFAVEAVDALALLGGQVTPQNHDVIVLADVDRLNARAASGLVDALRAGRGLFVVYGEQTDADSFNLLLHAAGEGPQPFRLVRPYGGAAGSSVVRSATIEVPDHPAFGEFEEPIYREAFQAIPVWRWFGTAPDSLHPDATVLSRVTDADRSPLFVARAFGEGKALFCTTLLASEYRPDRWNRFDDPIVAFPLLHGIVKWLALPAVDPFLVAVGAELACSVSARPEELHVQRPERDGRGRAPLGEEPRPLSGGRFLIPPVGDTVCAGFYSIDMVLDRAAGKETLTLPFAVNVDPDEGELRYVSHEEARQALGVERILDGLPAEATATEDADQSELGPTLLLLTLAFVLFEAALARYVSVRRSA